MAFLSRDAFDETPGDTVRSVPFGSNRPSSAAGRPQTAESQSASLLNSAETPGFAGEDVKQPTSQVNMREKMLQQRQKMMAAKNRQSGAGSMVIANASAPTSIPTPMGSRPVTSPSSNTTPSAAARPSLQSPMGNSSLAAGPFSSGTFEVADLTESEPDTKQTKKAMIRAVWSFLR
jgi:hypothetical protein